MRLDKRWWITAVLAVGSAGWGLHALAQNPAAVSSMEAVSGGPLHVMVNKSLLLNTPTRMKRVSVTDPAVADALVITPNQVLIRGRGPGEISLLVWDENERSTSYDLSVDVDVSGAAAEMIRIFPDEHISVSGSRSALVLSGRVSSEDVSKRADLVAGEYSKNIINAMTFGADTSQEVMLEVKFAEVDRSALSELGFNVFSTGAGNTLGSATTGQFGGVKLGSIGDQFPRAANPPPTAVTATVTDALNLFFFRPDIHLGAVIKALQSKNLLQILAEPNLVATNGKEASFVAGGEFPFPVVQPAQGISAVTIQFREFGVKLKFTPNIMPNGNIHLRVIPEVSNLDFANALSVSGTTIPALSTRRAETEFELQDGQSFVIAGLMDNRVTNIVNKVPGLGDIPILGQLFRSTSYQKNNSELMVLCTAHRVSATGQPPPGPINPVPFLDREKFDGKKPGTEPPANRAKPEGAK